MTNANAAKMAAWRIGLPPFLPDWVIARKTNMNAAASAARIADPFNVGGFI